jgi:uncharacterized protein (DUF362 family)/NAD-dependent dihydropyrimidine dehydrogenase PreA subunit
MIIQTSPTAHKAKVSLARLDSYDSQEEVLSAVRRALEPLGGMSAFVSPGNRVLLKVNLVAPAKPDEAVTTHPAIVRAVIHLVKECGGTALVGDGPGVGDTKTAMQVSGILDVVREEGAEMVVFEETATYENSENILMPRLELTSHLRNCDVLITLPKLKTHVQMAFTGAVKNQFGLIPGAAKGQFHFRFQNRDHLASLMIDINRTARTRLAIMDAVVAMEGNGPSGGDPRFLGAVIAGEDIPAVDVVACNLIGLNPDANPLNLAARRANWGTTRLEDIEIVGESLESLHCPDFVLVKAPANIMRILPLPQAALRWLRRQYAPRPRIDSALCLKCRRCANGCPVKPAAIDPLTGAVDDSLCIRCYCCHEFCPVKAISLEKSLLARWLPLPAIAAFLARALGSLRAIFARLFK